MKTTIRNPHSVVPDRFEPSVIAIVAGKGNMGRRLADEFFKDGYQVRLTREGSLAKIGSTLPQEWKRSVCSWNAKVCEGADAVVFSAPTPLLSDSLMDRATMFIASNPVSSVARKHTSATAVVWKTPFDDVPQYRCFYHEVRQSFVAESFSPR